MAGDGTQWIPEKRIAGIAARCSNDRMEPIGALWGRFYSEGVAAQVNGSGLYAVYFEYAGDYTEPYTLLLGAEIAMDSEAPLPPGFRDVLIEPGNYTVFDVSGPLPQGIMDGWARVWSDEMTRAYRTDFEMYHGDDRVSIYVGSREA